MYLTKYVVCPRATVKCIKESCYHSKIHLYIGLCDKAPLQNMRNRCPNKCRNATESEILAYKIEQNY